MQTQKDTKEFKQWFGNSKVVDTDGKPLVVYHGSQNAALTEFRADSVAYFTDNKELADSFADRSYMGESLMDGETPKTYNVYVSIQNPQVITTEEEYETYMMDVSVIRDELIKGGYDGIIYKPEDGGANYYMAINPTQIKSAIGNNPRKAG